MKMLMISFFVLWSCILGFHPAKAANIISDEVGGFTYIKGAVAKGAVCLDGSPPAYNFQRGHGSGANSWLIFLNGGGWCDSISSCLSRANSPLGSSYQMNPLANFTGILSNQVQQNPDFFNWNRVQVRYCDGASFGGEGENKVAGLYFRGNRIYKALIDDLMSKGMRHANQALLSGGSAGGVAVLLHCDELSRLFPSTTKVKCLNDAGLFLDSNDVYGGRTMRGIVERTVSLHGVQPILPHKCTNRLGPFSCFFPQNLINYVRTPLFLLNAAYDTKQIETAIAYNKEFPHVWSRCLSNITVCSPLQIQFFQSMRNLMVKTVKGFGAARQNGLFINSCFVHGQTDNQTIWLSDNSPRIDKMGISVAVGNWYFNRSRVKKIDCAYPCNKTCINELF